ncbi:helix-turn-helix domain-containing protein [Rickettsiales bacterium LUAb2]
MKNNLKKLRENKGLSTHELAKLSNISQPQIVYLETGKRKLTVEWAVELAQVLDCTPADIIGYENLGLDPKVIESSKQTLTSLNTKKEYELQEIETLYTQEVPIFSQSFACGVGAEPLAYERSTPNYIDKTILKDLTPNLTKVIGVKADGDSMYPIIKSGSVVLVDTALNTLDDLKNYRENLKNTFAFRHDTKLLMKILSYNKKTNTITAKSYNENEVEHKPIIIDLNQPTDFQLIGKVIASFNRF